jgi:transposase InsO family protein
MAAASSTFAFPNITSLVSLKLDGPNFISWTTQFLPALRAHDLLGIVDGSEACPSEFTLDATGKPTEVRNPDFLVWQKKDQFILAWINATLTERILSTVYGMNTAQQVWASLSNRFTPKSRTGISHLKRQLQTLNQGSKSCSDFLLTAKSLADQLVAAGKGVDDEDLISYVVGGLNSSYHPFITTLSFVTRDAPISFDSFQMELLNYEQLLDASQKSVQPEGGQLAFFTQKQKSQQHLRKSKFRHSYRQPPRQFQQSYQPQQHFPQPSAPTQPRTTQQRSSFPTSMQMGKNMDSSTHFLPTNRVPCQICGKLSHQALDCYHRMDYSYQGRHPPSQLTAMAAHTHGATEHDQPWYLDSGANHHITSELENLTLQQPYQGTENVTVGNGGGLQIANTGSSLISTPNTQFCLNNILHCPHASSNLLSIQKFCKDNHCYFILTATYFVIKDMLTKEILLQGPSEAGLYPIYLKQLQSNKLKSKAAFLSSTAFLSRFSAFLGVTVPLDVWHSRLGHPADSVVHRLLQQSLLPYSGSVKRNKLCDSCQVSKSKKLPFLDSNRVSTHPLALVHSDVWTSPILSTGGCKFYVIFIDDYSRFSWLFPLRQKSDVLSCFIKFKKLVENFFSCKIKQIQTDNGGEYVSTTFKNFTNTHGILHRLTCPYSSEQNGISERKHRHITETGLSLLAQSGLSSTYWVDAFLTATYLINRMPTTVLGNISLFFKLFQKHPNYSFLKTFGCACYPLLRPYTSHKLNFRSKKCVLIGYSSTQKGYRCLDLQTNHVYISRHVIFYESQFPAKDSLASTRAAVDPPHGFAPPAPSGIFSSPVLPSSLSLDLGLDSTSNSSSSHVQDLSSSVPTSDNLDLTPSPLASHPTNSSAHPLDSSVAPIPSHDSSEVPIPSSPQPLPRMLTRSQTQSSTPKLFPDYHLYSSTKYPFHALTSVSLLTEPTTYSQAVKNPCWLDAMQTEYNALLSNKTWSLCPRPSHKKVVRNKWVFKLKQKSDGTIDRYKARLVAKGFDQEGGVDFNETFSPVIKPATIWLVLALAVHFGWFIHQLDISNAFLHGFLEEEVFMEQPKGFEDPLLPDYVCRLHKSLYGLKQAPRAWFMRLSQALMDLGFVGSVVDTSLFYFHHHMVTVFVLIYVDDILVTSTSFSAISHLIIKLQSEFAVKDLGPLSYFLGIHVQRGDQELFLSQTKYITDLLQRTKMEDSKPVSTSCASGGKLSKFIGDLLADPTSYRHIVGALQYCTLTQPDIAYSVNQLCQFLHSPISVHLTAAKRVLRYLKGTPTFGLHYTKGSLQVNGYCDSDWANSPDDRKSTTGYGIHLGPCLISWAAKKQAVVAKSSTEAEYRSMAIAVAELYWIRMLFQELKVPLVHTPCLWVDNISALSLPLILSFMPARSTLKWIITSIERKFLIRIFLLGTFPLMLNHPIFSPKVYLGPDFFSYETS